MINDKPCGTCLNYDVIKPGNREKKQPDGRMGRCAVKSTYPTTEQEGQTFPSGVRRAAPGERAKIFVVYAAEVQRNCTEYRPK
jgi:hypothetical protein